MSRWILAALTGSLAAVVAAGCSERVGPQAERSVSRSSRSIDFEMTGLRSAKTTAAGDKVALSIGGVVLRRRSYGVFAIKPLKEILLEDFRARLELAGGASDSDEPASSLSDGFTAVTQGIRGVVEVGLGRRHGLVTRVLVENFEVDVYREGARRFRLRAGGAKLGRRSKLGLRDGLELSTRDGQILRAERGEFAYDALVLKVKGPYTLTVSEGQKSGIDATFQVGEDGTIRELLAGA